MGGIPSVEDFKDCFHLETTAIVIKILKEEIWEGRLNIETNIITFFAKHPITFQRDNYIESSYCVIRNDKIRLKEKEYDLNSYEKIMSSYNGKIIPHSKRKEYNFLRSLRLQEGFTKTLN